jgi:hypothetical protein
MWKMVLLTVVGLVVIVAIAVAYGATRWQSATRQMHAALESSRRTVGPAIYDSAELVGVPTPVQRYFRAALQDGQRIISSVTVQHVGTFNMSETGEQWRPFVSTQRVVPQRPGFVWDARIRMMPLLSARVHDAYVGGEGVLHASLFGLVSVANLRGTADVAHGELMRFFAEAAWYPTALLPSQGVQWDPVDDTSARATLTDGNTTVTLLFRFNQDSLIESMRADARGRTVGGAVVPTPWEGRWASYERRDGMLIPVEGEVSWILPEGPKPYWRGRITTLTYEFAH